MASLPYNHRIAPYRALYSGVSNSFHSFNMSLNRVDSIVPTVTVGAGGASVTPDQLKFAAGAASAGLGGAGAFVIGAVAPVPAAITIIGIGGCLYAAHRMENGLPIIPGRGNDDNAPASVDAVADTASA